MLSDLKGKEIKSSIVYSENLKSGTWNTVNMDTEKIKRGKEYILTISTDDSRQGIVGILDTNKDDLINLKSCFVSGTEVSARAALGVHQVYKYSTFSYILYFSLDMIIVLFFLVIANFTIINIKQCKTSFDLKKFKEGWVYTVFFSCSFLFMFNPMDSLNTEIKQFHRMIGAGVLSGYDVSRVIGNFNKWFFMFAVLFVLMGLFVSYVKNKDYTEEQEKAWKFLDCFMILASVNLLLRIITFSLTVNIREKYFIIHHTSYILL